MAAVMTRPRSAPAHAAWQRHAGPIDDTTPRGEAEREAIEEQLPEGDPADWIPASQSFGAQAARAGFRPTGEIGVPSTRGRCLDTEEDRRFWDAVDEAAREVETWPAWKRGGNVDLPFDDALFRVRARCFEGVSVRDAAESLLAAALREWSSHPESAHAFLRTAWHSTVWPPRDRLTRSSFPVWVGAMALAILRMESRRA